MSVFGDFVSSFVNPIKETAKGFKTIFTDPEHAHLSDVVDVALPFWGGTLVSDFNHPSQVMYQGSALALASGGAALAAPAAGAAEVPGSPLLATVGPNVGTDPIAFALQGTPQLATYDAPFVAGGSPAAVNVVGAGGATGGWGDAIAGAVKATGSFIKETALVSSAAKSVISPWQSAIQKGIQLATGGAAPRGTTVIGSGGPQGAATTSSKPAASKLTAPIVIGGAAVVGLGVWAYMKWRRS